MRLINSMAIEGVRRSGLVNAWMDASFHKTVVDTGRRNLLMSSVTTDVCLVFPSISAKQEALGVQAVMNAGGTPFFWSEDSSNRRIDRAGVILTATNTEIAELAQNWSTAEESQLIQFPFSDFLPPITSHG